MAIFPKFGADVHNYSNVFINGGEHKILLPLTLTLSPIGGEGIGWEAGWYSLSPRRGERAGGEGGQTKKRYYFKKSCTLI